MCDSRTVVSEEWTWNDVGARIAEARQAAGLTQEQLAAEVGIDRTAVTKLESGKREVDSLELAHIARALGRPVAYFVEADSPVLISRRAARGGQRSDLRSDAVLEDFARDARVLLDLNALDVPQDTDLSTDIDYSDRARIEAAATSARRSMGLDAHEPVIRLQELASKLGLLVYLADLGEEGMDGGYLRLDALGVAVVNAVNEAGRRRFTIAHELGHHLIGDAYSTDWGAANGEHEVAIDHFAASLLLPEPGIRADWPAHLSHGSERQAVLQIGIKYRASWTACLRRLLDLQLLDRHAWRTLEAQSPTRADYIQARAEVPTESSRARLPSAFSAGVLRAYRIHGISESRAIEMLRGALEAAELPDRDDIPLGALSAEMR